MTSRQHLNERGAEKRSWPTHVQAQRFADAIPIVTNNTTPLEAYCCRECGAWHVGKRLGSGGVARVELGVRVFVAMMRENHKRPTERRYEIGKRARAAMEKVAA